MSATKWVRVDGRPLGWGSAFLPFIVAAVEACAKKKLGKRGRGIHAAVCRAYITFAKSIFMIQLEVVNWLVLDIYIKKKMVSPFPLHQSLGL